MLKKRVHHFSRALIVRAAGRARDAGILAAAELREWRSWYFFRRPLAWLVAATLLLLSIAAATGLLERAPPGDISAHTGERMEVVGTLVSQPDVKPSGTALVVKIETARQLRKGAEIASAGGKLLLHVVRSSDTIAEPGDRLRAFGRVQPLPSVRVPGAFDYGSFLRRRGITAVMYTSARSVQNAGPAARFSLLRLGQQWKDKTVEVFDRYLPEEEAAVLAGLVVGSRPRFTPRVRRVFTESGTMHVLVASGSNVAFVVGLWFLLARLLLRLPRRWALGTSLPAIGVYALMVGGDPPIVRAGIMAAVGITAALAAREDRIYHPLLLAVFVMLAIRPLTFFEVGFRMSVLTVFGMVFTLPALEPLVQERPFLVRWPVRLAAATLTAQVWLFPITAAVFKKLYPVGAVSNLVLVPMAAGGLSAGLFLVLFDAIRSWIPVPGFLVSAAAGTVTLYARLVLETASFFADHPGWTVWLPAPSPLWTSAYYALLLSAVGAKASTLCRLAGTAAVGALLIVSGREFHHRAPADPIALTWIDAGRRLAVLAETKEGEVVLLDPGLDADAIDRTVMPFLAERRVRALALLVVTRDGPEAADGVRALLKAVRVEKCLALTPRAPVSLGRWTFHGLASGNRGGGSAVMITDGNQTMVLGEPLSLAAQDRLVKSGTTSIDVLHARFSTGTIWRRAFVEKFRPDRLVDSGTPLAHRNGYSPWPGLRPVAPQSLGVWSWPDRAAGSTLPENKNADEPRNKPAGVRPPRDAADVPAGRRRRQRSHAVQRLHEKPVSKKKERGDFDDAHKEDDDEKRQHARVRIKHKVPAQHARDRPGSADHRQRARRARGQLRRRGADAHQQIIKEVPQMPQAVFDVVAEDVQKPHVPEHVSPPAVQEHRAEDARPLAERVGEKPLGDQPVFEQERFQAAQAVDAELQPEHRGVHRDERVINKGEMAVPDVVA